MSILNLLVTLVVGGVALGLINSYIPMDVKIKKILNVVVIVIVVFWLLRAFGLISPISGMHLGLW